MTSETQINWIGLITFSKKEIVRCLNVFVQTVIAPVISTMLMFIVFKFIIGKANEEAMPFIAYGILMMAMMQNSFTHTIGSIVLSKAHDNIADVIMPPLSPLEITIGYTLGGIVRGVMVGFAVLLCMMFFIDVSLSNVFYSIYFALMGTMMLSVLGTMMLSVLGTIFGILCDKFEEMAAIQGFIILPATFLSGTFYHVHDLPEKWQFLCWYNPCFYIVDGFRKGFLGVSDASIALSVTIAFIVNLVLFFCAYKLFKSGYRLKV
ncbi:MAG: ABC transporter permease [Alphaproteobacteria bacterium]|nr:ABC transporter permease [Alphaproteobacteria bacterium]MCL2505224.1 ABC transporter permease [Alphaproteobacteria bacterium]